MEKDLKVWDVVNYDGNLVVVTEIDFTGKATITRENGSTTHIHKDFLKNAVVGNVTQEIRRSLLLRLDSKDELIAVLAKKLLNSEFGRCYMCSNPMKNITLDGENNGCDGECNTSEEFTVDDFLKKIISEMERKKRNSTQVN